MYTKFYIHKWEKHDAESEPLIEKAGLKIDENEGELGEAVEALIGAGLNLKVLNGKILGENGILIWVSTGDFDLDLE